MSLNFEIFPTNNKKPNCDELIKYSLQLFNEFLEKEKIVQDISIITRAVTNDKEVYTNPVCLTLKENCYTVFNLNNEGEVYVFYHELTDLDKDFWNEEIKGNKNAQSMKEKIDANLKIGYSWSVKRTMGQPAIVSLYYGYLAIAIAVLTDGIIYSDDGAWDYSMLPIDGESFKTQYLNIENISNASVKDNVERWLGGLKNSMEFFEKMQEFFPSAREEYRESIKEYGEVLETVVIEDIFMPKILGLLAKNENSELLKKIFSYFEEIVDKNDAHLVNVFSITVLEILGNDKVILDIAKQYMGPKTSQLQIEIDKELGRV